MSSTIHRRGAGRLASSVRPELPRRIRCVLDSGFGLGALDIVMVRLGMSVVLRVRTLRWIEERRLPVG